MNEIPEGWYERIELIDVVFRDKCSIQRRNNGNVIEYVLKIDDYILPATKYMFESLFNSGRYMIMNNIEYKYLDAYCQTYSLYSFD